MPTITHDITISATFRLTDDAGNTTGRHTLPPMVLDALTPLAALSLYETLAAKRNEARRAAGLREIAQPDVAVVLLAALREFAASGADPSLERIAELVCETVGQIARERGQIPEPPPLTDEDLRMALAPSARNGVEVT